MIGNTSLPSFFFSVQKNVQVGAYVQSPFASMDAGGNPWATMTGGGVVGLFFGLVSGGVRAKGLDWLCSPGSGDQGGRSDAG